MKLRSTHPLIPALGLACGLGLALVPGCDPGDVAEACGLDIDCEAGGFAEGQASISGIASVDAFFGAAIDLDAKLRTLDGKLRAELDGIAVSVGLEPGASSAEIQAALTTHLEGYIDGGLTIEVQPPKCEASVEASVAAAAECDVEVDPGEATVRCEGSCAAEAGVAVDCGADATLMCEGTAPMLACSGTCTGSCAVDLDVAASCEGTCRGTCEAGGSVMDNFDGKCAGMCQGECVAEIEAGGSCEGRCEGTCEYQAPEGGCEASASASCEAMAGASIECDAGCEGSVEPPSVSAECEATVEAKASASVECQPPSLSVAFQFRADLAGDIEAQATFRAWLEGFRGHISALVAAQAEADLVLAATTDLIDAAGGVITTATQDLEGGANLKVAFGARCALLELPVAADALTSSVGSLQASASATGEVLGGIL